MINEVKKENITFAESPTKFEAGTMQTAEVVAFSESIKLIEKIGLDKISENENEILKYGMEKIRKNNSINLIGDPKNKASVISFTLKGVHPHDIATILDNTGDEGFCIKNGKIYTKDQTRRGIWIRGQIMDSVSKT